MGVDRDGGKGLIFNVFKQDASLADASNPKYAVLTRLGGTLREALRLQKIPISVSYVNPSNLDKLLGECKEQGINTTTINIPKTS